MATKWFISRQCYWGGEEPYVVEIARGGRDYANPDMYVAKYPGEGEEYGDPREAAKVALDVAKRWKLDEPGKRIGVAYGYTGGYTMPFTPSSEDEIMAWAQSTYEKLPKCDMCGVLLPEESKQWTDNHGECRFCSDYCMSKSMEDEC